MKLKNIRKRVSTEKLKTPINSNESNGMRYLDLLLDEAKEILAYIDVDLRYSYVNKAYAHWLGYQKSDFTGKYVSDFFDEDTFTKLLPKFIKAFRGERVDFTYCNEAHSMDCELIPHFEESVDILGCIWRIKVLNSEKKESIEPQNHNRAKDLLPNLPGVLTAFISRNGDFLEIDETWSKALGYDLNELKTRNLINLTHADDKEITRKKIGELKKLKQITEFSNRLICKDGTSRWYEWHLLEQNGRYCAIGRDITHYINSLASMEASINKLNELNSSKDQFFAIIAHDLKSPLSNILGFTDLLKNNVESYEIDLMKQILGQLYNASKIAYELLENLLDWSRLQTDRIEFEPIRFSLGEFLNNYLSILQPIASTKQIIIQTAVPENLHVFADQNLTKTVLRNLVSNAVKFSNPNDSIIIKAEQTDSLVKVSIIDKGVGIPAKDIHKLFRIDTKYSTPGTMNEKGTGLGLILCKDFIEKQGGKIWVESKVGKGSIFSFTLPCK